MTSKLRFVACFVVAIVATAFRSVTAATPENSTIPLENFFAEADITAPQVSPDGTKLAFLTMLGTGKVGIALMHLETGKIEPLVGAKDENIDSLFWKGNDYLVYGGDIGGNESQALRSFHLSKKRVTQLADSGFERSDDYSNQAIIVDTLLFREHELLVYGPKEAGSFSWDLYFMDIRDGKRRTVPVITNLPDTGGYIADNSGAVRARTRLLGDKTLIETRASSDSNWTLATSFPAGDPRWSLLRFAADNENLYVLSTVETDTPTLHTYNTRTNQLSAPIFRPATGEIDNIVLSYDRSHLLAVTYSDEKPRMHFVDDARARLQAQIDASLPNTTNFITSRSADEKIMVIVATSDRDPGTYYLLNLRSPRLMPIGKINSKINPAKMRPMQPIKFTARDGLEIHGYLTRPDAPAGAKVPLIVNPHGGPFGIRDEWGFNPEVQFLASRGYAVLQVNYRGSGGYGEKFLRAGAKEWGGKMQDDLTDGVKWAIEQGFADPKRIAIYGASYGGYAALAGVTLTPELYCCAANYVGVSDLNLITSWGRGRGGRSSDMFAREWIGDDKQYKFDRSPVNFVDRIRVPTLHAYGYNDPRVEIENWTRLEPKLKQFGKSYEIHIEDDEGHGFENEKARIAFYRKLETFFARHLAPAAGEAKPGEVRVLELPAKSAP